MITVEKAIKDGNTKRAVEGADGDKKKLRKKVIIGVAVAGGLYLGYRLIKMRNAKVQPTNQ